MNHTILCILCIALFVSQSSAQIPRNFSVQCVLTDQLSNPISDGFHKVTIKLYASSSGGIQLFTEEFSQNISKGIFQCVLGEKSPLPATLNFNSQYFIGISYDDNPESVRIPLLAVPYSLIAEQVPDGSITQDKLSPALRESLKTERSLANTISGTKAFIGGGDYNSITNANYATITAGKSNSISNNSIYATVGGGNSNSVSGSSSTIAGGNDNSINAQYSTIGGGISNVATGNSSVISGGNDNYSSGQYSSIGGGFSNSLSGNYSTISGGNDNSLSGIYSTIAGGYGLNFATSASGSFGFNSYISSGSTTTVSSSNTAYFGNVHLWLGNTRGQASELRLYEAQNTSGTFPATSTNYTAFKSGSQSADITYTLPTTVGANGQFLQTNGTGGLSWQDTPDVNGIAGGDLEGNYPNPSIANGSITVLKLASGVIPTTLPPSGTASGDLSGNYPNPTLSISAVTSVKIADSTITNADIAANAGIIYSKLNLTNSIVSSDLTSSSVTGPKIGSDAVTTSKIADLTIQSNDIKDNAIISAKIADTNVTMSKIAKSGATSGQVIGWNGNSWVPTNLHQSTNAATLPALQIGTTSSATGYLTFASKLMQNNFNGGSTLAAGSSVYELTGTVPSSTINLPTGVPSGTSLYLLNSTSGSVGVAVVGGSYVVLQNRAMQFLYSGNAWYPLGN
ncbi:MAG: hypothetical protein IPM69_06205 [Ignavibacteria bacterium]|nr:hypothetical protein [Ignavibacteria bacterium]